MTLPIPVDEQTPIQVPFYDRVAFGTAERWTRVRKFGAADNVGTSVTPITTSKSYQMPTAAQSLELLSSDANDTSAGTGARTVIVEGLGSDWTEATETVTMNGITPVALSTQFVRVYRMKVATSGTYAIADTGSHAGTLTLRTAGGGPTWASIVLENGLATGQSQIACYTVPKGKTAWVTSGRVTLETGKSATLQLYQRPNADVTSPAEPMRLVELNRGIDSAIGGTYSLPAGPFVGPCDLLYIGAASSTTVDLSVVFDVVLTDTDR